MSKYKIVPVEPTPEMEGAHEVFGDTSDWWNAVVAVAPAPVASAEDVERVAKAIHMAYIMERDCPFTAAEAALRAMGYEVKG